MALLCCRSAGLFLPIIAAVGILGNSPVAIAVDDEAPTAASALAARDDDSASRSQAADLAIPELDVERLASANRQLGPSAQRSSSRSADARPGLTSHLAAVAGGLLVVTLIIVGIALTIVGLRDDLRKRRRGYRRRSRRVRAPIKP